MSYPMMVPKLLAVVATTAGVTVPTEPVAELPVIAIVMFDVA